MNLPVSECGRAGLIDAISVFLARGHVAGFDAARQAVIEVLDEAQDDEVRAMSGRLAQAGSDWTYYDADPLARRIHHALALRVLREPPRLTGGTGLATLGGRPVIIIANHLSYSDVNVLEVALHQNGASEIGDRLIAVAGPKVYTSLQRRFSSLCFGTIKVPQSTDRASEEAVMTPREVAQAARRSIEAARDRLRAGAALVLFAEGSRSRDGAMQPFLAGAARYLDDSSIPVLPVGLIGTDCLFPVDGNTITDVALEVRCGQPVDVAALRRAAHDDRQIMMDALGVAVANLLPASRRGVYRDGQQTLETARAVLAVSQQSR
jgi:1-acyl-sn-glycerol-3-phosphate acyltransferase